MTVAQPASPDSGLPRDGRRHGEPPPDVGRGAALRWWARKSASAVIGYGLCLMAAPWILAWVAVMAATAPVGTVARGRKPCSSSQE